MAALKWLSAVVLCAGVLPTCTGQKMTMRQDICSYSYPETMDYLSAVEVGITDVTSLGKDAACMCDLTTNQTGYVSFYIDLAMPMLSEEGANACNSPLMYVDLPSTDVKGVTYPGTDYYICPAEANSANATHRSYIKLESNKKITFLIINPKEDQLTSSVKIYGEHTSLSITCHRDDRWTWKEESSCPCTAKNAGKVGEAAPEGNNGQKVLLGVLIPVLIIAFVVIGVVLFCYLKKKRRDQPAAAVEKKATIQENRAYEGSQQEVNKSRQPVNMTPDPALNLNQAKPNGRRGSPDSGFPSDQSNNRYANQPAPHLQAYNHSQSMENVNEMPQNYPSLAGQGSHTSLDNPALMNPAEVDAFYNRGQPPMQAAPMQRTPQQYPAPQQYHPGLQPSSRSGSRSGSINALNVDDEGRMVGQAHTHTEI